MEKNTRHRVLKQLNNALFGNAISWPKKSDKNEIVNAAGIVIPKDDPYLLDRVLGNFPPDSPEDEPLGSSSFSSRSFSSSSSHTKRKPWKNTK